MWFLGTPPNVFVQSYLLVGAHVYPRYLHLFIGGSSSEPPESKPAQRLHPPLNRHDRFVVFARWRHIYRAIPIGGSEVFFRLWTVSVDRMPHFVALFTVFTRGTT